MTDNQTMLITVGLLFALVFCPGCKQARQWTNFQHADPIVVPSTTCEPTLPDTFQMVGYTEEGGHQFSADFHSPPRTNATGMPDAFWDLSLDEAITIALSDAEILRSLGATVLTNPQAVGSRFDPAVIATDPNFGIEAALAQFDTRYSSNLFLQKNDDVFNNPVLGGNAQEVREDVAVYNYSISKTSAQGSIFSITGDVRHTNSDSPNLIFSHLWQTSWEASIRQPLLQGAGVDFNRIAGPAAQQPGIRNSSGVVISRINHQISQAQFERQLRDMVGEIISAYWRLDLAHKNFKSIKQLRDASLTTWNLVKTRMENDIEGGEADREAQAREQYFQFQSLLVSALNGNNTTGQLGIFQAEADLRRLLNLPQSDDRLIRPSDSTAPIKVVYDWNEMSKTALSERIEIQEQSLRIRQRQLELLAAKNFLLPRLDAIATYRNNGFGDDLASGGPRFASALADAFTNEHGELEFGLAYNMTIGYRQAHAGVRNAELQLCREKAVLREQQNQLLHELGSALRQVDSIHQELSLSRSRLDAAEDTVNAREVGFETDVVGFDELLEAQRRLLESRLQYFQTEFNYETSRANLVNQSGRLLEHYGVRLANQDQ